MYTSINFRTKKQLKEALAAGTFVDIYQPGGFFPTVIPENGTVTLEGPHYPEPHRWYATGIIKDGKLVAVK